LIFLLLIFLNIYELIKKQAGSRLSLISLQSASCDIYVADQMLSLTSGRCHNASELVRTESIFATSR